MELIIGAIVIPAAVVGTWMMIVKWHIAISERARHDSTAFNCKYWSGDRKGYSLLAHCNECGDDE